MRAELDAFKRDAHERERRLEDEITQLKAQPAAPGPEQSFMSDLEDDAESMELATPLQPTLILMGSPDPPDIPLPPSPALPDQFEMDTLDLEHARADLDAAEARLREKDAEMMRLQLLGDPALMTQLQQVSGSHGILVVRLRLISPAHRRILN